MIANMNKSNTGKLLVAVLAMAMIVAGTAVVLSDSEVNAVAPTEDPFKGMYAGTSLYDVETGAFTVTANTVITLNSDVGSAEEPLDMYFVLNPGVVLTITGDYSVYITNVITQTTDNFFVVSQSSTGTPATIILTGGVDAHFATVKNVNYGTNNHVINGVNVTITDGSKLTMTQSGTYSSGVAYYDGNSPTLIIDDSELVLSNAGGVNAKLDLDNGKITVENPKNGAAYITLNSGSTVANGSVISVPNGPSSSMGVQIQPSVDEATTTISDSSVNITGGGIFQLATGAKLDATGSGITAPTINVRGTAATLTASVTGGTIDGNITGDGTSSNTLTLDGVVVEDSNVEAGVAISVGANGLVISGEFTAAENSITTTNGSVIAASGSNVKVPGLTVTAVAGSTVNGTETTAEKAGTVPVTTPGQLESAVQAAGAKIEISTGVSGDYQYSIPLSRDLILAEGVSITLESDSGSPFITLNGHTIQVGSTNDVVLKVEDGTDRSRAIMDLSGTYSVSQGNCLVVNGQNITGGTISLRAGTTVVSGTINGNVSFTDGGISDATEVIFRDLTINSGATLTLLYDDNVTYSVAPAEDAESTYLYLYGTMIPSVNDGTITIDLDVADGATFTAYAGASLSSSIIVSGAGDINLDNSLYTHEIDYDIGASRVYGQMENVIIIDSMTIRNNSTVTIMGTLEINEGVTMTVDAGSTLKISSAVAKMIVDGTLEIMEGAHLIIDGAEEVTVTGNINSDGEMEIGATSGYSVDVTVKEGGKILVDNGDVSELTITGGLTIEAGAEVEVRGLISVTDGMSNKGTVTLNGATLAGNVQISMAADSAVVDIVSFSSGTTTAYDLTITDDGLVFKDKVGSTPAITVDDVTYNHNSVVIDYTAEMGLRGLTVTESVTSIVRNGVTTYTNTMALSGSITGENGTDDDLSGTFTVSGPSVTVLENDTLTLGTEIDMVNGADFTVAGAVNALTSGSSITNSNEITVTGTIQLSPNDIGGNGVMNAAKYETETADGDALFVYTTLENAVASGDEVITVTGTIVVESDLTIPANVSVRNNGTIEVGTSNSRDVTLTVADSGEIRNGTVDVYGTLEFENKRNNRAQTIISDVSVIGDVSSRYTNIYTALANAQPGETVTITKTNGDVEINSNITIPEGIILDVPSSRAIKVMDGVTVTVNGTLRSADAVKVESVFAERASTQLNQESSAIVVNGAFMSMADVEYASDAASGITGYYISGAYYTLVDNNGNYNYVTPIETAASVADDVTGGVIDIYGTVVTTDVTFTGTENVQVTLNVTDDASLVAGTITLSRATMNVAGQYTGTVASALGSVQFENITGVNAESSFVNEEEVFTIGGTAYNGDSDVPENSVTIATGTVTLDSRFNVSGTVFNVESGANLIVDNGGELYAIAPVSDYGVVNIAGTVTAQDGGLVSVNTMVLNGTLTVSPASTSALAGSANVNYLYAGISEDYKTETAAAVNGEVSITNYMVVSSEATVDTDLIDSFRYTLTYNVEDVDWITVYSDSPTQTVVVDYAPIENSVLEGWSTADYSGDGVQFGYTSSIPMNVNSTLYADIEYDIYRVVVIADQGIGTVAIDGQVLTNTVLMGSNVFLLGESQYLAAGTHTISWTLKNSFEGDIVMTVNGETVTGDTFTLSGTPGENDDGIVSVTINLTGAEPSNPVITVPGTSDDNGMGLTDYLLIILVILIVIMAIMVAFRLMRS